ncbi:uncharacterized protein LDX57_005513 [Aspergillus melleus]|uniref:uncharacterized protein n=1 Tax=Aspergillus melleus TaxID=138277 RepID=UPI001E8DA31A|nr:uncharacterized protein LDX57_005513 [Aspergillus melleus]KAH8427808.1 hypothetical protein LDX57_005513 [Aspergillus melleus]
MSPVDTTPVTPFPIWARDIASDLKDAPETLSSWDNCMAKSYCKWPVIAAIIVGGVIVISVLACVINCLCCGYQCCKSCCCSCCCPSRNKNRQPKYMDDPYNAPLNQPYNQPYNQPPPMQPPPMQPPAPVNDPYKPSPSPATGYRGAQVARFDSPSSPGHSKFNEDALPAMPSWDNAVTRRVEDSDPHSDAMEMEPLNAANQPPHRTPSAPRPNAGGYSGAGYNGSDYGSDYNDGGYNGGGRHGPGYMGVTPVRTGGPSGFHPESRAHDIPRAYTPQSPAVGSPAPMHPYEQQPYHDYSPANGANPWNSVSPAPRAYTPQPQYMATGPAMSPSAEAPRPIPYRQPSPGFAQAPMGHSISPMDGPRPIPYRQPSPGFNQAPVYQAMSPSIPSSPPPPFTSTAAPHEMTADPGRPPSLLQSGRKPAPNSYRDV